MATRLQTGNEDTPDRIVEKRRTILLVEDNSDDAFLVGLALRGLGDVALVTVPDGQQAIQYLKGPYADRGQFAAPQLILLDLDMPVMNGFQFLEWLRQEPTLKELPVIVLTTSASSPDVNRAYRLGANSVLAKPTEFTQLSAALNGVIDFWLPRGPLEIGITTKGIDTDTGASPTTPAGLVDP